MAKQKWQKQSLGNLLCYLVADMSPAGILYFVFNNFVKRSIWCTPEAIYGLRPHTSFDLKSLPLPPRPIEVAQIFLAIWVKFMKKSSDGFLLIQDHIFLLQTWGAKMGNLMLAIWLLFAEDWNNFLWEFLPNYMHKEQVLLKSPGNWDQMHMSLILPLILVLAQFSTWRFWPLEMPNRCL